MASAVSLLMKVPRPLASVAGPDHDLTVFLECGACTHISQKQIKHATTKIQHILHSLCDSTATAAVLISREARCMKDTKLLQYYVTSTNAWTPVKGPYVQ